MGNVTKAARRNSKWIEEDDISKFDEQFIKNYDENSDEEYIFEVDVEYPKNLHEQHGDLPFLPERTRINNCTKLVCSAHDKENFNTYISTKTSIKSWIKIRIHSVTKDTKCNRI